MALAHALHQHPATGVHGASGGRVMAGDADWVEDVRRWWFGARRRTDAAHAAEPPADDLDALGYEAACPPLQACGWPDAPPAGGAASRT
jgi:hypothetical protein